MRRTILGLMSVLLITTLVGCSDSYEKVAADMVSNMQLVSNALKSVKDKASAEAAAAKINGLGGTMDSVQARLNKLGKPTKEIGDELNAKYSADITRIGKEIAEERDRISKLGPEVIGPVDIAMRTAMQSSMKRAAP